MAMLPVLDGFYTHVKLLCQLCLAYSQLQPLGDTTADTDAKKTKPPRPKALTRLTQSPKPSKYI